ncbi:PxKF domain-containing protein [Arthrobacter sp. C152]
MAAGSLLLTGGGVAWADDIYNNLDTSIDSIAELMPLNAGGANGSTTLAVRERNSDGKNGCNLTGSTTLTLNLSSSNPAVATVSPSIVVFTSCNDPKTLTISPVAAGSATVTATQVSNTTIGTFDLAPATFTVNVAAPAPSNTAPVLNVTGVTAGASYTKGSVPAALCSVTDTEDGPSTFAAKLGAISGTDAAGGVGSQTASCSYTDKGGLTASGSVTYGITDGSAPEISYTLSPATPDGLNDWYKSAVSLHWIVTEEDSPSTVALTGCEDQNITEDLTATDFSCAATSSGGTSGTTVNLGKDATAPTVAYTTASGDVGSNGWYTSDVEATFIGADATSGLLAATQTAASSGEGATVKVDSPAFTDIAGNTTDAGAASHTFKIDKTAPEVSYSGVSTEPNANGWYNTDVTANFAATDLTSGPATPTQQVTSSGEGAAVEVASPAFSDNAGNTTAAGAVTRTFKVDKTAPTVSFDSVVADGYFGATAAQPTCTASDSGGSGLAGSCVVTGYGTGVGRHTLTAKATDLAGNITTVAQSYEVKAWTLKGFYQPVDMNGVLNTVKNGSTVPAKFEIFAGDTELTDPALAKFTMKPITCSLAALQDAIETTATGNTSLRYDATSGQFIYNWKTPTAAGTCYTLTMTANDGSAISANFKLK